MKLDLNFTLKHLSGEEITGTSAGKVLAGALSQENKGNSIKLWDWALKLYNDKPLELDSTDFEVLTTIVEQAATLTVLVKAQILSYTSEVKAAATKIPAKNK
jgi:hypothetical protein